MATLSEIIKEQTALHLADGGKLLAENVCAVGWIGGTVPELTEADGIVELPTSDVANSGIVCGFALANKKPIYVIRYQGFLWYNMASLANYAAKSYYLWHRPCKIFIRAIGMEGNIGPVASGTFHSLALHMPGFDVFTPITPEEWLETWNYFNYSNHPMFCSEHRKAFPIQEKNLSLMQNTYNDKAKVTAVCIGITRLNAIELLNKRDDFDLVHLFKLKPFVMPKILTKNVIIFDSDYSICGASQYVGNLLHNCGFNVLGSYGKENITSGFNAYDHISPTSEVINRILDIYV